MRSFPHAIPTAGLLALFCHSAMVPVFAKEQPVPSVDRTSDGLIVLYDFADAQGDVIRDRSGIGSPVDLKIGDPNQVKRSKGSLEIRGAANIQSTAPAKRMVNLIKRTDEVTIEAWLEPKDIRQKGPARIVTLSKDASQRNVTLGQEADRYSVRLRTRETKKNGLPALESNSGSTQRGLQHVVYVRSRRGVAAIWVNGKRVATNPTSGELSNWDSSMRLAIGDEITGSRPWRGTIHMVAVYNRALRSREILNHFTAGAGAETSPIIAATRRDPRQSHFELEVAPILANSCLECHDSLSNEGGLDLSTKLTAMSGGDSGVSWVAKNAAESLLWQSVESDQMPHERDPLTDREKEHIRQWINDGAVWTLDRIDPAVYVHGGRPDANWLRRLTVPEYIQTVQALFDLDITNDALRLLPQDLRADGFSNTAYNLNVDLKHIEAYQQLAEIITSKLDVRKFARQFKKDLRFTDKDMGDLISKMGRLILRGPLEKRELVGYRGISTTVAATEDGKIEEAIELIVQAMLQSPRFLYRVEHQRGDGSAVPVDEYELASRMSYIIWGGPPDEALLTAAEQGKLDDPEAVEQVLDGMLADSRAMTQSERFFSDWLNLSRLDNLQPNPSKFPDWDPKLAEDMRKETLAFFREVIWKQRRPLSDLLKAKVTFATPRLARHYALPSEAAQVDQSDGDLIRYDLTKTESRGGILTQGSLLTVGGDEASMVTRGLLVMHELLRGVVKDPPPCVDTTPVPTKPGLSQRTIAQDRISNAACGGCHGRFEPLAFGLERFDGLGSYHRQDEHGNELREDGEVAFPGSSQSVPYASTNALMELMAASERVRESLTWKLTQFALGRPLTGADAGEVQAIHQRAMETGGTYQATLRAIITSKLVTQIQTDTEGSATNTHGA